MPHSKTELHVSYGLGGDGAVATRAVADIRGAVDQGRTVLAATDRLTVPLEGVPVFQWGIHRVLRKLPYGLYQCSLLPFIRLALERAVRRVRPDAIVFHESTLAWAVVPLAWRLGARSCFIVHALVAGHRAGNVQPYDPWTMRVFTASNRYALRNSDRVACVSRYTAGLAEAGGAPPENLRVLPNPVDVDRFSARTQAPRDIDVLFVGRLSVEKGVDTLIHAVAPLSRGAHVVIAGDGAERRRLEELASELGARITFLGWVSKADLPDLVRSAHIQIIPSRSEALPMVALEALASGTPVIASRVGGLPEMVVNGENGFLIDPGDVDGLRQALGVALADRARIDAMRPSAYQTAARYSPSSIAKRADAVFLGD